MDRRFSEVFPILDIEHDCILSKCGDITVGFEVELPEIFTRSNDDYVSIHQGWVKAIKVLPKHSVFHKQDWFVKAKYKPDNTDNEKKPFLVRCSEAHFEGREYLSHRSYIYLTKRASSKKIVSAGSSLLKTSIVPQQALDGRIRGEFVDICGQFKSILEETSGIKLRRLKTTELASNRQEPGVIERYCYLLGPEEAPVVREHSFGEDISIGERHCQIFTLADVQDLPSMCGPRINYERYSTDKTKFPVGFVASLGLLLPANHLYNQFIFIEDPQDTLKQLETKRTRLHSLSAYSRGNAVAEDGVNAFLNEAIADQRLPVKAHFNVMVWSEDRERLKDIRNLVSTALAQIEAVPKVEIDGAPQIWWAGIPGNEAQFPVNDTFDTFCDQACCFINSETNYGSAPPDQGVRFCDRISSRPVFVDLYNAPRHAGISSNMGTLVCGTSGGGKSMTLNHILRTLYDQGAHIVVIDIGGSYKGLCELVKGFYFSYTEENPIRFNPFFIPAGEKLDTEKKESLKALLVSLWKHESESFNRSEYVALSNSLEGYYDQVNGDSSIFPCFDSFYEYLSDRYVEVLKSQKVKDKDFDVDNFLYVLRPYYKGGEFDFLLNATTNLDLMNQPFVVIEMDNIKDHPILSGVVTLTVVELFISKMRKLKGVRKVLTIDEAWKAISRSGMAEFVKYAFKTIRKFNGIPIVATQELDDLISSEIIKDAIINNADVKILMDMRKYINKFDKLQDVLGLSEKAKTILLSVNKDNREIYVDIGGQITKVFKNELCREEYYAYTTEGKEKVKVLEYAERFGGIENGIIEIVKEERDSKRA